MPGADRARELVSAHATFVEQAAALAEAVCDLFVIETFRHLDEMGVAIAAAREAALGLLVVATPTFDSGGTVADGTAPEAVASILRDFGPDVIGVNCGDGPQLSLSMAERMRGVGLPLYVQPNAGLPRTVDGRLLHMATPEYFDVFARRMIQTGARIVGGCCGTTPEHIRWMARSVRMLSSTLTQTAQPSTAYEVRGPAPHGVPPTPVSQQSEFARKIAAGKFVVSVEVNPDPGTSPDNAPAGAKMPRLRRAPPHGEPDESSARSRRKTASGRIAREMLFAFQNRVQGAYLMPPLGRYELALEVLGGLKR